MTNMSRNDSCDICSEMSLSVGEISYLYPGEIKYRMPIPCPVSQSGGLCTYCNHGSV